ncbi:MAG: hypothetical protein P4L68_10690, partial [Methylovirgula sp.]|nr:hypothetical protein [Methylovirgula sp.]
MGFKVAVVGATGNVGREMLDILAERRFPADEVVALASSRSIGTDVSYGDKTLVCKALENYDFSGTDLCLMSAGGAISKEWSPKIGRQGCVVIDNSSAWRMDPEVPLVVPEVNADAARGFVSKYIIANPNCSTAQLVGAKSADTGGEHTAAELELASRADFTSRLSDRPTERVGFQLPVPRRADETV